MPCRHTGTAGGHTSLIIMTKALCISSPKGHKAAKVARLPCLQPPACRAVFGGKKIKNQRWSLLSCKLRMPNANHDDFPFSPSQFVVHGALSFIWAGGFVLARRAFYSGHYRRAALHGGLYHAYDS